MSLLPLRILTIADVPPDPDSGAAGTVYRTNQALRELGHHVDEVWEERLGPRRIRHGNLHSLIEQPLAYRREAVRALRRGMYDVVQMSQPQAWLATRTLRRSGFPGLVINRSHGVELRADSVLPEWHARLNIPMSRYPLLSEGLRRVLHRQWSSVVAHSDGIIVGCRLDRDYLLERFGMSAGKVAAIAHGVAPEYISSPLPSGPMEGDRNRRLLHVGQFAFFKGSYLLLRIIEEALVADEAASFTWVCAASHHRAIRQRLAPRVQARVRLLDWMSTRQLVDVYDDHGVFVFPSLFEGFGKAPFEAMARRMCVIASDEGGMRDLIEDGRNGWLCPPGDTSMFVRRIAQAMSTEQQTRGMQSMARETAVQHSWSACAKKAVEFYQSLRRTTSSALEGAGRAG